jgi:phosphoribosylanthranilate isomerase
MEATLYQISGVEKLAGKLVKDMEELLVSTSHLVGVYWAPEVSMRQAETAAMLPYATKFNIQQHKIDNAKLWATHGIEQSTIRCVQVSPDGSQEAVTYYDEAQGIEVTKVFSADDMAPFALPTNPSENYVFVLKDVQRWKQKTADKFAVAWKKAFGQEMQKGMYYAVTPDTAGKINEYLDGMTVMPIDLGLFCSSSNPLFVQLAD